MNMVQKAFKAIFYFCAGYFFLMGSALAFFPAYLIRGITHAEIHPVVRGMLRGAGGAILPYALLYILIAHDPVRRRWALSLVLLANGMAILLDLGSVFLGEYKLIYASLDIPVEIASMISVFIILAEIKRRKTTA